MRTQLNNSLIADDKKNLSQFILDLCGFTLDNAGSSPATYAFHLHIAFRRQMILQSKQWDKLCRALPLKWQDESSAGVMDCLKAFAQSIVDEVLQSNRDPWGVKLLKTGYLSQLDKARKNTEMAIRLLANASQDMSISQIDGEDLGETLNKDYLDALQAHRTYLDTLLTLPFVLEKFCLGVVANNKKINYVPQKSTEMLTNILDLASLSLDEHRLTAALRVAVRICMPELPIDEALIDTIKEELLPFIKRVMQHTQRLDKARQTIFPANDVKKTAARQALLSHLGVRFDSLRDVIQHTLLDPVHQCAELAEGIQRAAYATGKSITSDKVFDRAAQVGKIFSNLEQMADVTAQVDESLLPPWLRETSHYYRQLHQKADQVQAVVQTLYDGFGVFYNHLIYFIPQSVRQYFVNRDDDFTGMLRTVGATAQGVEIALVYLTFYELATRGDIKEPLTERFFNAYVSDLYKGKDPSTKPSYSGYQLFRNDLDEKELVVPLHQRILQFASEKVNQSSWALLASDDLRKLDAVLLVHQLKELQFQFNNALAADDTPTLAGLMAALKWTIEAVKARKEDRTLQEYRTRFLNPAIDAILLDAMAKQFIPLLERVIGYENPAISMTDYNCLPSIYAKLKTRQRLSEQDHLALSSAFGNNPEFPEFKEQGFTETYALETAFAELSSASTAKPALCFTPHQSRVEFIKTTALPNIAKTLNYLLDGLDKQKADCQELLKLSLNKSHLSELCQSKITYIDIVKGSINKLLSDIAIHADTMAQKLDGWMSGLNPEALKNKTVASLTGQLIRFAWLTLPVDAANPDDTFLHNVLTYYFQDTTTNQIYQAQKKLADNLNQNPIPELMPLFSDPLTVANIIPAKEKQMDTLLELLLGLNQQSILSWGSHFLKTSAQKIVNSINKETLAGLFPYPFVGVLAYQMLQSEEMQALLGNFLAVMATEYSDVIADKALYVAGVAKDRLYQLLGVQLQKTMENRAYAYAISPNKKQASQADRDAFAYYYLQYRAIKQQNTAVDNQFTSSCVGYLFKASLRDNPKKAEVVDHLVKEFSALDARLQDNSKSVSANRSAVDETQTQLLFLIEHLDFNDPENDNVIRMALVNRYLLMALDASEQLNINERYELQQTAIEAFTGVLKRLEMDEEAKKQQDKKAVAQSSAQLLLLLKPSKEKTVVALNQRIRDRLQVVKGHVDTETNARNALKTAKPPRLGRTVMEVEYGSDKGNNPRRIVSALRWLYESASLGALWFSILAPLATIGGASGALQSLFILFGVGGVVGATASIVGAVILGVLGLVRLSIKIGNEFLAHRKELNDISHNPHYSGAKKAGFITLMILKCLGLALIKTILSDFLVTKIANAFALGPLQRLRNGLRVYPTLDKVEEELGVLQELNQALQDVNELLGMPNEALDKAWDALEIALGKANTALTMTMNDARNTNDYQNKLTEYKTIFDEIKPLHRSQQVMQRMANAMQPAGQPREEEPLLTLPKQELPALPVQALARIDLNAYYEKTHPKIPGTAQGVSPAPGYTTTLISGFFRMVESVGRFFSWQKAIEPKLPQQAAIKEGKQPMEQSVPGGEPSVILLDLKETKPERVTSDEVDVLLTSLTMMPELPNAEPHSLPQEKPAQESGKSGWFNFWGKPKPDPDEPIVTSPIPQGFNS